MSFVQTTIPVDSPCTVDRFCRFDDNDRVCGIDWGPFVTPFFESHSSAELDFICGYGDPECGKFCSEGANMCMRGRAKNVSVRLCGYQYL